MNNIAIIPARSGSKGLVNKNIRILNGKPLIAYTIQAAKDSGLFSEIFVSTDSEKYAKIAIEFGASVPFLRSQELSSDSTSTWDVVSDSLERYDALGIHFDSVALLQPTSPLRTCTNICEGYELFTNKDANSVVAVCEAEHSPLWFNTIPFDLSMNHFVNSQILSLPRQALPQYYRINGALYIVRTDYLLKYHDIYRDKSFAYIMDKLNSVDIDEEIDFMLAETILRSKIAKG